MDDHAAYRAACRAHARNRAKERTGCPLSDEDIAWLEAGIRAGHGVPVHENGRRRQVEMVVRATRVSVIFDDELDCVVTLFSMCLVKRKRR